MSQAWIVPIRPPIPRFPDYRIHTVKPRYLLSHWVSIHFIQSSLAARLRIRQSLKQKGLVCHSQGKIKVRVRVFKLFGNDFLCHNAFIGAYKTHLVYLSPGDPTTCGRTCTERLNTSCLLSGSTFSYHVCHASPSRKRAQWWRVTALHQSTCFSLKLPRQRQVISV